MSPFNIPPPKGVLSHPSFGARQRICLPTTFIRESATRFLLIWQTHVTDALSYFSLLRRLSRMWNFYLVHTTTIHLNRVPPEQAAPFRCNTKSIGDSRINERRSLRPAVAGSCLLKYVCTTNYGKHSRNSHRSNRRCHFGCDSYSSTSGDGPLTHIDNRSER